jgi:hypothetical protein
LTGNTLFKNKVNTTDFSINHSLLLGSQLCGLGRTKAKIIPGMMSLANNPMAGARITTMDQELGLAILQVGKEVLKESLERKKSLSQVGLDEKEPSGQQQCTLG